MKHVYPVTAKTIFFVSLFSFLSIHSFAQNETTVVPAGDCNVVEDFNLTPGSFTSSSIYSESTNTYFNWNETEGHWIENTSHVARTGSLLSGVYVNNQMSGGVVVGFKYKAPAGSYYRVRVLRAACDCGIQEAVLASTYNGGVSNPLPGTEGRICINILDNDIRQNDKLRFEISIRTVTGGEIIIDDFSLGERSAIPLPVTFKGISARTETAGVKVLWDVAQEVDVKEYVVEKSTNGVQYTSVGTVAAQKKPIYELTDVQPNNGVVYYRVKNVDIDGRYKYSSVVRVTTGSKKTTATSLKIYPVPAQTMVRVAHDQVTAPATITVTTSDGRIIKTVQPGMGSSGTAIDISALNSGIYLIHFSNGEAKTESLKMVKL